MSLDLQGWTLVRASQIEGEFQGFDSDMIFHFYDGTYWYQSVYKYLYYYSYSPQVRVYQKSGRNILIVNGLNDYVDVIQTTGIKSVIVNDFNGWSGNTIFEMQNGQIWKQDRYQYKYFYAYRPQATIVKVGSKYILNVKGRSISVKQIK